MTRIAEVILNASTNLVRIIYSSRPRSSPFAVGPARHLTMEDVGPHGLNRFQRQHRKLNIALPALPAEYTRAYRKQEATAPPGQGAMR